MKKQNRKKVSILQPFLSVFSGLIAYFPFVFFRHTQRCILHFPKNTVDSSGKFIRKIQHNCALAMFYQIILKSNSTKLFFFTLLCNYNHSSDIYVRCGSNPTRCLITTDKLNMNIKNVLSQTKQKYCTSIHTPSPEPWYDIISLH